MAQNLQIHSRAIQIPVNEIEGQKRSARRHFWELWKRAAKKIGDIQARILLTVFYVVILGPFALVIRHASDPLGLKAGRPRGWTARIDRKEDPMKRALEQF